MPRIISIHHYTLKPGVNHHQFEQAIGTAEERGLLRLPGLVEHYFLKGIKGAQRGQYAAVWVYESRAVWEDLWGPPDHPRSKQDYPASWKEWEQLLAPFLDQEPDQIEFTAYEEL